MNVLLTGASSFTGYWIAHALVNSGHRVTAAFSQRQEQYKGLRRRRVEKLPAACRKIFSAPFGSRPFIRAIERESKLDLLCQHAAHVQSYKSPDFDVAAALRQNTRSLPAVLDALEKGRCRRVLLTGSIFEAGEGGGRDAPAMYPYGLSKSLTTACFKHYALLRGIRLGHFVIPNPFGPMEESRFTAYLHRAWKSNEAAVVNTPDYLRDNIHVDLLAKAYADFAGRLPATAGFSRCRPSGYAETQGAFARRYAREMRRRLGLSCKVALANQVDFSEPMKRINSHKPDSRALGWVEGRAWDGIAAAYRD